MGDYDIRELLQDPKQFQKLLSSPQRLLSVLGRPLQIKLITLCLFVMSWWHKPYNMVPRVSLPRERTLITRLGCALLLANQIYLRPSVRSWNLNPSMEVRVVFRCFHCFTLNGKTKESKGNSSREDDVYTQGGKSCLLVPDVSSLVAWAFAADTDLIEKKKRENLWIQSAPSDVKQREQTKSSKQGNSQVFTIR